MFTLISRECVFPPILHGSISQFDILLHGQLASHNAQSATEPGVRGHARSQSWERAKETEAEAAHQERGNVEWTISRLAFFTAPDQR